MSSDSALPLAGSLSGQAAGRNIYMGPVFTVAYDPLLAPCTPVPTATVPRTLLSGVNLAYYVGGPLTTIVGSHDACVATRDLSDVHNPSTWRSERNATAFTRLSHC